jgi:hypothetical protein
MEMNVRFVGTFQGQWLRGLRHGYGVRTSAPFGMASHFRPKAPAGSMTSLKSESAAEPTSERYTYLICMICMQLFNPSLL